MMRIAFITRSTLYKIHGGSAVQITETARHLRELGAEVRVFLTHEKIRYEEFDLLHFFDIIRPANILYHIKRSGKPFVISPVLVDYSEYDREHRKGGAGFIFRLFPAHINEYLKTIARWVFQKDSLQSKSYLWKGQRSSIREILQKAKLLLPNSEGEYEQLRRLYGKDKPYAVIPNGINTALFRAGGLTVRDEKLVICAARLEGIKNQYNLIKALSNTAFTLMLIGDAAPSQASYLKKCRDIAGPNIIFLGRVSQEELVSYYRKAKVHILPSWFETCGLSSLEAAAIGCNIVITAKGFTRDYFGDDAVYCDPGDVSSIYKAVQKAANNPGQTKLQEKIVDKYTWQQAAVHTLAAYKTIIGSKKKMNQTEFIMAGIA